MGDEEGVEVGGCEQGSECGECGDVNVRMHPQSRRVCECKGRSVSENMGESAKI